MTAGPLDLPVTTDVRRAAQALLDGGLVAFPTETVYGLGGLARDDDAVRRVFSAKGRPPGHPLIVHLSDIGAVDQWAAALPAWARALAEAVWPGPLTLVVERATRVSDVVTGGLPTVGLRVPAHPVALELLARVGSGVAAPSANRFGTVSPTSAAHVVADLADRLDASRDLVLDGGDCPVGVESTIVQATGGTPRLLRPGALSEGEIAEITGRTVEPADGSVRAPGTLASHYAPTARVILVGPDALGPWEGRADSGVIAPAGIAVPAGPTVLAQPRDAGEYARDLYRALRGADDRGLVEVVAVLPEGDDGLAVAIRDRLRRAAR